MISRDEISRLIEYLEQPLEFYEDPIYTSEEKEAIKKFEDLAFEFYMDLKRDGYVTFSELNEKEEERRRRFTRIVMDISNKLVRTSEFTAEESWFILLSLYCWSCEIIKNFLLEVAIEIYRALEGKEWQGFMTLTPFVGIMSRYKNGRYAYLFSEIDVDLRNSFVHGKIGFLNDEMEYYDSRGKRYSLELAVFLSKYKKIPPLYATLFFCRKKVFVAEIKEFAKSL